MSFASSRITTIPRPTRIPSRPSSPLRAHPSEWITRLALGSPSPIACPRARERHPRSNTSRDPPHDAIPPPRTRAIDHPKIHARARTSFARDPAPHAPSIAATTARVRRAGLPIRARAVFVVVARDANATRDARDVDDTDDIVTIDIDIDISSRARVHRRRRASRTHAQFLRFPRRSVVGVARGREGGGTQSRVMTQRIEASIDRLDTSCRHPEGARDE